MKLYGVKLFILPLLLLCVVFVQAQPSLLSEGEWIKYRIPQAGFYRIRGIDLQGAGISLSGLNPENIRLTTMPGGPLLQELEGAAPPRLREIPVMIIGVEDGTFDAQDVIVFYAEGPHKIGANEDGPVYHHNPYAEFNYVFVGINAGTGARISMANVSPADVPQYTSFTSLIFYQQTVNNLLESGREWYGQRLQSGQAAVITFTIPNLVPGSPLTITSAVMAQTFAPASFSLTWEGQAVGEHDLASVPDFLDPPTNNPFRYSLKGTEDFDTFTIPAPSGNGTYRLQYSFSGESGSRAIGYLNYALLQAERSLLLENDALLFSSKGSGSYRIQTTSTSGQVWDITDIYNPRQIPVEAVNETMEFSQADDDAHFYGVFRPETLPVPALEGPIANQNLPESPAVNVLIVTHPDFLAAAQTLAAHRSSYNNYQVQVVTTDQIYNEYSSGRQDVTAIRNHARSLFMKGDLQYLLLMGKGTYDYLNILGTNTNYVPTYQSRNSLAPLDSYASDDFYGFLEEGEGKWEEVSGGNHTLDIGVGRLPVTSSDQAMKVVNKVIQYDLDKDKLGAWRTQLTFVADDEDFNLHHRQAERLAVYSDTSHLEYKNKKIYLGSFPQESGDGGTTAQEANDAIDRAIQEGSLIVNYTGHGNENVWAQEAILTRLMIEEWQNKDKLPLFVTATCEFGRHDNPRQVSGGEMVVTMPQGGGIALLSTGRPVFSSSNFAVNRAFYASVFALENGKPPALGDVFRNTKNASIDDAIDVNRVGNRNFTLLGDPSQVLGYPQKKIDITSITGDGTATDSLKAGSRIMLQGEVRLENGLRDETFNGKVEVVVYDVPVAKATIVEPEFIYQSRENILFKGKGSVNDGRMSFDFIVPLSVSQSEGNARIQLYAYSQLTDAAGASDSIKVGGFSEITGTDNEGPDIAIYFGDSTNTSRTDINDNTLLFVKLSDESGVNLTGFSTGNGITAILDEETFLLDSYYSAVENSYQEGWVAFPLYDLEKGEHTLTIKAWDVYNNPGETTIDFVVADPGTLVVKNIINYPQPVFDHTSFRFDHNRAGETLEVVWELIGSSGQFIEKREFRIENSPSRVELTSWNDGQGSKKLDPGIYFYSIGVRSSLDGASTKKYQKLILIN